MLVYRDMVLAKNSRAYALWEEWQKEKKDKFKAQEKLDQHLREVNQRAKDLLSRTK